MNPKEHLQLVDENGHIRKEFDHWMLIGHETGDESNVTSNVVNMRATTRMDAVCLWLRLMQDLGVSTKEIRQAIDMQEAASKISDRICEALKSALKDLQ